MIQQSAAKVELRAFSFIDSLQPQLASFIATVSRGFLPMEGDAALFVEISPGLEINVLADLVFKGDQAANPGFGLFLHPGGRSRAELAVLVVGMQDRQGAAALMGAAAGEEQGEKNESGGKQAFSGVQDHRVLFGFGPCGRAGRHQKFYTILLICAAFVKHFYAAGFTIKKPPLAEAVLDSLFGVPREGLRRAVVSAQI